MSQRAEQHKTPVEQFKVELAHLQINLMEYEFYASALGERSLRSVEQELVRRHIAVARDMDRYARETGQPATYETSLLAKIAGPT